MRHKILWIKRCFYLSMVLVIFLASVLKSEAKQFDDHCYHNGDCEETKYCNKEVNRCSCITEHEKIRQIFDTHRRICAGVVGSACTISEDSSGSLPDFHCISNSECTRYVVI